MANVRKEEFENKLHLGQTTSIICTPKGGQVWAIGVERSHVPGDVEEFDNVICEVDLVEPSVQDNLFTWTSKVLRSGMLRGLDCILVNGDWLAAWPRSRKEVEHYPTSDASNRQASLATEVFCTTVRLKEASLRQKFRIRWLELSDHNTVFFYRSAPIGHAEVRMVLFSMDSGKASGPNGFSISFFKGVWNVVGEDFL
ncbi:LINE-1 reverse transcriptase isogeny [Cucumis melo var. makuwa]|uniref:LINE-1 reverse transcriptase isogeny n=1 Tax=Cucumis melo var. makuwa TaxID=1194695 RepID=A0A5D3BHD0_CUCMM|nr:LINE-1 reverse transcriptase isogeny [Cucumis melo var. makuwa]